jgi:hypothetical protein
LCALFLPALLLFLQSDLTTAVTACINARTAQVHAPVKEMYTAMSNGSLEDPFQLVYEQCKNEKLFRYICTDLPKDHRAWKILREKLKSKGLKPEPDLMGAACSLYGTSHASNHRTRAGGAAGVIAPAPAPAADAAAAAAAAAAAVVDALGELQRRTPRKRAAATKLDTPSGKKSKP